MKIYQVGGVVRDRLLGLRPHDVDRVVVGGTPAALLQLGFLAVGQSFPVFLHPQTKEEYALARKEIKIGPKHTDFEFVFTPEVSLKEDLERRDFTCNAIAYDEATGEYIDYFGGRADIENRVLRVVNPAHFQEDPLRVLRMCRFAAQLDFKPLPETLDLCRTMVKDGVLRHLSVERIWAEFMKAMQTPRFEVFVRLLQEIGALQVLMPSVSEMFATPEKEQYHAEGTTGGHVLSALQAAANQPPLVKFAVLLHDVGKVCTPKDKLPAHHGHEARAEPIIRRLCQHYKVPKLMQDFALLAAREHMKFFNISVMRGAAMYALAAGMILRHTCFVEEYIEVCRADFLGSTVLNHNAETAAFEQKAEILRAVCRLLQDIKATDMPNFAALKKDQSFKERLRAFRIDKINAELGKIKTRAKAGFEVR